jgi:hypothetical protein
MPGVPRELVEHALNMDPKAKSVKQPLRRFDEPKRKAIASELHRLENAGFIRASARGFKLERGKN